ncbi:DUF2283 domain-containing protein [Candidatus Magnetominusculus xianensis]|uniref:DUF2283 domain-containing protein n=1 Tax=Candidatus Magnetominusculus xianensis TaxID=1748249 RepID=A0ABR5SHY9_9BACT|nr:DUF2283 domain-containing protein [Candidatus Magnetominusculus xianensis]KWT91850.1 hypothetical protein ASN18_0752 [Candidatus Magnetominusculus xianensis]MBF0403905.1 DUF2283 domain-containing protein [Nitrospirota bacterium]
MESIKILEKKENFNWDYDQEADVLYISVGEPEKALGIDIGEGVIMRYVEDSSELVGLTIVGIKERFLKGLKNRVC